MMIQHSLKPTAKPMCRRPLIAGNWKMNLGRQEEARAFVRRIRPALSQLESIEILLCPPFTVLASLAEILSHSPLQLGAQTLHWNDGGAHTGEISPTMLRGLCRYVIIGHSERRAAGESDDDVHAKVHAALKHDLIPILCFGEDLEQNEAGRTDTVLQSQIRAGLAGLSSQQARRCVLAYEPIWAIGTGRSASPAEANRTIGITARGVLADVFGEQTAQSVRILYGGSVKSENIAAFTTLPEIDGALVGGASLDEGFVELAREAARTLDQH